VRSFVRREGRITEGQRRALAEHWPRYGLDTATKGTLDLASIFGRHAPVVLEIGCGDGLNLFDMAQRHPEQDYIGAEVYRPGLGALLLKLAGSNTANVRLTDGDAVELLHERVPERSLEAVHILFPDPWPKKRHHKRRLIKHAFAALLANRLKRHGRLYLATDWPDYALHMLAVLDAEPGLINLAGPGQFAPRPHWRPTTKYERRAQRLGHSFFDLIYGAI
jgi:tRNA (guanine-N7-)-methyltransferase